MVASTASGVIQKIMVTFWGSDWRGVLDPLPSRYSAEHLDSPLSMQSVVAGVGPGGEVKSEHHLGFVRNQLVTFTWGS